MSNADNSFFPLVLLGIGAWFLFGNPSYTVAKWFYKNSPAPWEEITAIYYPNKNDLSEHVQNSGLDSLDECREWVGQMAFFRNDAGLDRGDYECGVTFLEKLYDIDVYRLTLK